MAGEERRLLVDMLKTAGVASADKVVGIVETVLWGLLRDEFHQLLSEGNLEIWQDEIVMGKFDRAVNNLKGKS